ncbi:NUDIX hydrolase domain-containing protein [Apiospora kogelbergensis]|uniref:NUDIX hydrolase domain-containing protein n=1 Tax=Apiospora kogelbergensis TaxID=1337665 RepID=UPI00312DC30A
MHLDQFGRLSPRGDHQLYTPPSPPSRISHYQYPSTSHKKPLQHPQKVLLVQRSRHDYGGLCWEIPGGSCDPHDVSILDAAARELTEEAGLRVRRFVAVVDRQRHEWIDRGELWRKLTFIVEADDADTFADGEDGYGEEQERGRSPLPRVRLDPEEHEDFVWATREDLMVGGVGERMFTWIQDEQRQVILRALDIVEGVSSTLP